MNTALQGIMACYELSYYFMTDKYKEHINENNPIGTKGVLARAYAMLLKNVYNGTSSSYSPWDFKRAIGGFQQMFIGYQQHDTMEFLNYLLDGLHEDLNLVLKKPLVEKDESHKEDKIKSEEQWIGFLRRNQSVLVKLLYGQYKSTLYCPNPTCENISTTFDPFLSLTLPILNRNESYIVRAFYIAYEIKYKPVQLNFEFHSECNIMALRNKIGKILSIHPMSFIVVKMNDEGGYDQFFSTKRLIKSNNIQEKFTFFLFQINPKLFYSKENSYYTDDYNKKYRLENGEGNILEYVDSRLKEIYPLLAEDYDEDETGVIDETLTYYSKRITKSYMGDEVEMKKMCVDGNYGFNKDWYKIVILLKHNSSYLISKRERIIFPRVVYIHSSWTTKKVHMEIFKYFFNIFVKYESLDVGNEIDYEKYFAHYFGDKFSPQNEEDTLSNEGYPYRVRILTCAEPGRRACFQCKNSACHDCLLPYDENITVKDLVDRIPKKDTFELDNNFLFLPPYQQNRMLNLDLMFELSWLEKYSKTVFTLNEKDDIDFKLPKVKKANSIPLADCFRNFMKIEKLQPQNEWYCPQCKSHQLAKKQMEIYKAPPILILHLKRFTNNSKISILIDYPLKNLDLTPFINHSDGSSMKYDLFAVSNHYGSMCGGHYVSYAQNYFNKKWYTFDDSWCNEMNESNVVADSGYVLFYRRQDICNLDLESIYNTQHIDFEPEIEKKKKETKKVEVITLSPDAEDEITVKQVKDKVQDVIMLDDDEEMSKVKYSKNMDIDDEDFKR